MFARRLLPLAILAVSTPLHAQQPTRQETISSALAAAPAGVARGAAVVDWEGQELRPGTNGWTCLPDVPNTPGNDPMCLDEPWMMWAQAWQAHEPLEIDRVGLAYMLVGGSDASNTDPWATEPAPGDVWVNSGPHVMIIVPDVAQLEGIPTDPDNGGPWVMWKGTPYAHIMMPTAASGR